MCYQYDLFCVPIDEKIGIASVGRTGCTLVAQVVTQVDRLRDEAAPRQKPARRISA